VSAGRRAGGWVARAMRLVAAWDHLDDGAKTAMQPEDAHAAWMGLRRVTDEVQGELEDRLRQSRNFDLPGNEP